LGAGPEPAGDHAGYDHDMAVEGPFAGVARAMGPLSIFRSAPLEGGEGREVIGRVKFDFESYAV